MSSRSIPDEAQVSTGSHFVLDETGVADVYQIQHSVYEALREEIVFILEDRIAINAIKIHAIESRVKELPSLLEKCVRKATNDPFSEFVDIAAARVICLFRSDIERLKKVVGDNFDVISIDDKVEQGSDPLGYLSIHMICKMKAGFSGPRYEKILGRSFEIQLRTLCMHCWAAVSHYVDYKGDWDVPANLKMALSALSGLFYVADSEFEQFNAAMAASKKSAEEAAPIESEAQDINLDTVTALLRRVYPDRTPGLGGKISELVHEIKTAGYRSLDELESALKTGDKYVKDYERKYKSGNLFFVDMGAARHALEAVSSSFAKVRKQENKKKRDAQKEQEDPL